ncbi:MAG: DUF6261 family protein [Tannerellaceae bacterium]|jgi:hypothetical protein|nr:DUF6261 family protein [Tannerellaceae bacterium]
MKTIRIPLRSLHNGEWFEFLTNFKDKVSFFGANAMGIKNLFDLFLPLYNAADKALLTLRRSVYSKEIEEADKKRDELFQGFYGTVKSARKQPDAAKQKAAERLYNLLKRYQKSIASGSHAEESAAIYNLLEDLRTKTYDPDVTLLGLAEWTTAINQAEGKFLSFDSMRNDESFAKPKEDLRKVRSEIDVFYTAMMNLLDIKLLADGLGGDIAVDPEELDTSVHNGNEVFTPEKHGNIAYNFVVSWNEVVKRYRNLLQQRAGRRAKKEEDDPSGPIEE